MNDVIPATPLIGPRERLFASLIWRHAGLSRRDLHERTATHPTLTGHAVTTLIQRGLVREGPAAPPGTRGRPQVPLEIDTDCRTFVGLAIAPGAVSIARVDARGRVLSHARAPAKKRQSPIAAAAALLRQTTDAGVFAVGVSITGLVVPREAKVLFSSALPASESVSVRPIYDAAGAAPVVLHNDTHALALKWLLTSDAPGGDVLLVAVDDGRLGASLLLDGRPQEGVVSAANELGHTRLAVETDTCYCGQNGCLERIVSSPQLARFGVRSGRPLDAVLADPRGDQRAIGRMLGLLATGIANAVNFVRPARVIVASPLVRHASFADAVTTGLPPLLLPGLRERVSVGLWEQSNAQSAENAAWLALADVFGRTETP